MRVLVTGGAGFIGSHLCSALLAQGKQVICVDNFSTGSHKNIAELFSNANFELIEHDITEPLDVGHVDEIFNLACPASPRKYQSDPIGTMKTSVLGALTVLELARKTGARILQASTSEVYGDPLVHPQAENYFGNVNPIGIRACYDEGKRAAETLFHDYQRVHNVDIKIVRIFNTYGPNMSFDDGRVISNFVYQALQGEELTVFGDGTQTRSFCYVDDLIAGMLAMMSSDASFSGPVNLGNPEEISILELGNRVIEATNSTSQIEFRTLPDDDPKKRKPDISLASSVLNWTPTVNLETGLAKTVAFFAKEKSLA